MGSSKKEGRSKEMLNKISQFAMAAILVGTFATLSQAQAQTRNLEVDSDHSDARFSVDGTMNGTNQTIVLAAAGVAGTVNLNKDDLTRSTFAFRLYPATSPSPAIDEFGKPTGNSSELADYTLVSFESKRVTWMSDGKLKVSGTLLVTRAERDPEYTLNEAYSGPVYGPPIVHRSARPASFIIAVPDPTIAHSEKSTEMEASTVINQEDFPQLMEAVLDTNWPPVIQDEKCSTPVTVGEDYAGASCTGKLVQASSFPVIYTAVGEDYSGAHTATVQLGNNLTILVHMQLPREDFQVSAKASK
jgi:hypothetical protein